MYDEDEDGVENDDEAVEEVEEEVETTEEALEPVSSSQSAAHPGDQSPKLQCLRRMWMGSAQFLLHQTTKKQSEQRWLL